MSLENQVARVSQGTKDTLKALINKLGGNVTDELIDQYPSIASALADAPFKPAGTSYLTFSSPNSFTLKVNDNTKHWDGTLEYFASNKTWAVWDGTTTLSAVDNDGEYVIYIRGTGNTVIAGNSYKYKWVLTGTDISCIGNIENLLDYATVQSGAHSTMAPYCYSYMFSGCTSLTQAPALPATTLADYCYSNMFYGCTALTQAPALPATTLAFSCYSYMFYGCTALTQAPALPATTLADYCYSNMFYGCTALTQAPALPATTLANYCYQYMFQGCTSLTQAPSLPATTLTKGCYYQMFQGCTSLTQAPTLPATTLASYCYYQMFQGCTSLTQAPALPATTLASYCYQNMFRDCTSLKFSSSKTDEYTQEYRIPSSGTGTTATNALYNMFKSTGGTFTGTPDINTTYYLSSDNMVVRETEIATLNGYVGSMIDSVTPESIGAAAATHASQHASDGSDPITPDSIGAYSKTELDTLLAGKAPAGYGLGGGATKMVETDFNNYIDNGVYTIPASMESIQNAPPIGTYGMLEVSRGSNAIIQDVWGHHWGYSYVKWGHVRRVCTSYDANPDSWSEWEWPEPPFAVGTVYRTTEKHLDSPVYKKMDSNGVIWWSTDQSTWKREAERVGAAPAYTYGTTDLTAGSSSLETGKLYFVYE